MNEFLADVDRRVERTIRNLFGEMLTMRRRRFTERYGNRRRVNQVFRLLPFRHYSMTSQRSDSGPCPEACP